MFQVDHLDDNLKSFAGFQETRDTKAGPCSSYLECLLFNIVSRCLVKHSRRVTSEEVCMYALIICAV